MGFTFDYSGKHIKVIDPSGESVNIIPKSPSDKRGLRNNVAFLKRIGVDFSTRTYTPIKKQKTRS